MCVRVECQCTCAVVFLVPQCVSISRCLATYAVPKMLHNHLGAAPSNSQQQPTPTQPISQMPCSCTGIVHHSRPLCSSRLPRSLTPQVGPHNSTLTTIAINTQRHHQRGQGPCSHICQICKLSGAPVVSQCLFGAPGGTNHTTPAQRMHPSGIRLCAIDSKLVGMHTEKKRKVPAVSGHIVGVIDWQTGFCTAGGLHGGSEVMGCNGQHDAI